MWYNKKKVVAKKKGVCNHGRALRRSRKRLENNPIQEYEKIRRKYLPNLYQWIEQIEDPRNQSYISYGMRAMIGTILYKNLIGLVSMRSMNEQFEEEEISEKVYHYLGEKARGELPHSQTLNDLLSRIKPEEIEKIRKKMVYSLIRRKSFDAAKYKKTWPVYVDGTELYSGKRKLNEHCLEKRHKKGTNDEKICYQSAVLEAKIDFGGSLLASIGSEFIENAGEDAEQQRGRGVEQIKQDCEIKAFRRLSAKLKKQFPRLPIRIQGDSLYACGPVFGICEENKWQYLLRYKGGSIPSIEEEFVNIPEKGRVEYNCKEKGTYGTIEFVNDISYQTYTVHMLRCTEHTAKGETKQFQFLSSTHISNQNAKSLVEQGRNRWKIENQGFKRQKREAQRITHVCCWNAQAMKNHYLLQQIADFLRKLYEIQCLNRHGIQKTQRKISSDLLHGLYLPITEPEDTS